MNHLYILTGTIKKAAIPGSTGMHVAAVLTCSILAYFFLLFSRNAMDDKRDNKASIKIPRPLYNSLKGLINDSGFNSVNDFIVYILRDIVANTPTDTENHLRQEEIETIKERLRNLGYLT
jgi:hypothetical protein